MKRRRLTPAQKTWIIDQQKGRCDETGCEFMDGDQIEFDHRVPLCLGGPDTIDNLRAVLSSAHKVKTKGDIRRWSKARRQAQEAGQQARRDRRGHGLIQSRGFSKTLRKRMDGSVVARP